MNGIHVNPNRALPCQGGKLTVRLQEAAEASEASGGSRRVVACPAGPG